jgi:predicted dienelactone hydrolase
MKDEDRMNVVPRSRPRAAHRVVLGLVIALGLIAVGAHAQDATVGEAPQAPPARLATDIREAVVRVPVSVENHIGRTVQADLIVTTFRPAGQGPFPLVVLNHGRPVYEQERAAMKRQRLESAARFFVRKGFAVAVPTRIGY